MDIIDGSGPYQVAQGRSSISLPSMLYLMVRSRASFLIRKMRVLDQANGFQYF